MNILLVNPRNSFREFNVENSMFPYSLLYLSSYLKRHGYPSTILDLSTSPDSEALLRAFLSGKKYDLIGFTGTTENRFHVRDLIRIAHELLPRAVVVVGGDFYTFTPDQTLQNMPEVDIVVRREGEITLYELVDRLARGDGYADVAGISFRESGQIVHNPDRPFERDIEKLIIDDDAHKDIILPNGSYTPFLALRNFEKEDVKALPIHVGRGCPGKCIFCMHHKKLYRARKAESVLAEIKRKMVKYDCKIFHLDDPHLLKRDSFIRTFCETILEEGLDIKWYAETRADIDLELIPLMARAGCVSLDFAIESASPKVIKAIRKGIRLEQAEALLHACHQSGIRVKMFTMISLPDETYADAMETIRFLEKYNYCIETFSGGITRINPGSDLEKLAVERGIFRPGFDWYDNTFRNELPDITPGAVPLYIEHLSTKQIRDLRDKLNFIKFRPATLGSACRSAARNVLPFLFKWGRDDIRKKRSLIDYGLKSILFHLKYGRAQR